MPLLPTQWQVSFQRRQGTAEAGQASRAAGRSAGHEEGSPREELAPLPERSSGSSSSKPASGSSCSVPASQGSSHKPASPGGSRSFRRSFVDQEKCEYRTWSTFGESGLVDEDELGAFGAGMLLPMRDLPASNHGDALLAEPGARACVEASSFSHELAMPMPSFTMQPNDGMPAQGLLPSLGSAWHMIDGGDHCTPCPYFWQITGCRSGRDCHFCHLCARPDSQQELQHDAASSSPPEDLSSYTPYTRRDSPAQSQAASSASASLLSINLQQALPSHSQRARPLQSQAASSSGDGLLSVNLQQALPPHSQRARPLQSQAASSSGDGLLSVNLQQDQQRHDPSQTASSSGDVHPSDDLKQAHLEGRCKPCSFFWKSEGCRKGDACLHCHLCTPDVLKDRKYAKRYRARVLRREAVREAGPPPNPR
eukprot:TRINITY_DN2407_c0_g1_i1.p1 TRINITY_DN2407_c0_g1~~TRINITY_DN2407_c0_g1_i1.p1  ORF type:complete len:424 (-),score=56.32 TRINITY_DN2407_c0_g1_i1:51-1322(-)